MSRQYWKKKVRFITPSGDVQHITSEKGEQLIASGLAECLYQTPLTLKAITDTEYQEEQQYLSGRITPVTKGKGHSKQEQPIMGNHSTRARPPRQRIDQCERDFQRYKTTFLTRRGEEDQARARRRARA